MNSLLDLPSTTLATLEEDILIHIALRMSLNSVLGPFRSWEQKAK
jgi:hypothetical protein